MNILLLMIPLSLLLLGAAIWAFVWAVRRGQFEDLDTPALDILREDAAERAARRREAAEQDPEGNDADSGNGIDAAGDDDGRPPGDANRAD